MTPTRDPNGVEPTLLPAFGSDPPNGAPASPDTPPDPGARDATIGPPDAAGDAEATRVHSAAFGPDDLTVDSDGAAGSTLPSATVPVSAAGGNGAASPSATGTMVGRFALKDLHARGGLGEVFTARDSELNREVAVKRIKSQFADDPSSRRRFLTEAEITARLDHPGVVPVFGLVSDARGRPCYAMRFVRGETLKDEIDRYHGNQKSEDRGQKSEKTEQTGQNSSAPGEAGTRGGARDGEPRTVAFRHLLQRFISVCQAVAYAHTRNVIHRDIKPANIMVGAFGETLVVDWGLAKALDDGPDPERLMKAAAAAGFRHDPDATELPSHATMAGTAVGTPAYMAPEQAAGRLDLVGPKADIYSLGATLFAVLTGRAAFTGSTAAETLDRVRRGAFEPPRAVNPDCPPPLDAVCRKAMALDPAGRYPTALELAADVERWLSDEPVSCHRDPLPARLARWARRHPARVAAGVSLLLAGALAAAGIAWAVHEGEKATRAERDNVVRAQKETEDALKTVNAKNGEIEARNRDIEARNREIESRNRQITAARDVARQRYEAAVSAYNTLVHDIDRKMADRAGTQDLRKTLLLNATEGLQTLIAGGGEGHVRADRTLVAAYRQTGEVYQMLGETAKARASFQKAVRLAVEVRMEVTTPADRRAAEHDLARSLDRLAGIHLQAGDTTAALAAIDDAIRRFEELARDTADAEARKDLAAARAHRARILAERGETAKALDDCKLALAARESLATAAPGDAELQRDLALSLADLAGLQLRTGRTADALTSARKCLTLRLALAEKCPRRPDVRRELADAHALLGDVHLDRARVTDAVKEYRAGLDVLVKLSADDGRSATAKADLGAMHGRLAHALVRTGEIDDAVTSAKAGMALCEELRKADPDSADARRGLALARELYGDALLAAGRTDEALAEFAASVELLRPLRDADPDSARARLELARALERLGDGRLAARDFRAAVDAHTESVALRDSAAARDPDSARARRELATGLGKLADAHTAAGRRPEARDAVVRATDLFAALAKADPDSGRARRDLAVAYGKWGQVLAGSHPTGALVVWLNSLDRFQALAALDAGDAQAKADEALAWERLAGFYATHAQTDRARSAARKSLALWGELGDAAGGKTKAGRRRLALAMLRCGDIDVEARRLADARAWYKKAQAEVGSLATDAVCGPVANQAADQLVYLDAVEAAVGNPAAVLDFPARVRVAALKAVVELELRAGHPVNAGAAADQLAALATTADELFVAARAFALCLAVCRGDREEKVARAAEVVARLEKAVERGFRDGGLLTGPEWEAVARHSPEFAKLVAKLK